MTPLGKPESNPDPGARDRSASILLRRRPASRLLVRSSAQSSSAQTSFAVPFAESPFWPGRRIRRRPCRWGVPPDQRLRGRRSGLRPGWQLPL